jgi:hypothetical protein
MKPRSDEQPVTGYGTTREKAINAVRVDAEELALGAGDGSGQGGRPEHGCATHNIGVFHSCTKPKRILEILRTRALSHCGTRYQRHQTL